LLFSGAGMCPGGGNGGDGDWVGFEDTTHTCASSCLFQKATHGVGTCVDGRVEGGLGGGCGGDAVDAGMLPGKGLA
jgi:hypothetical protein